jgi:nitroreductase
MTIDKILSKRASIKNYSDKKVRIEKVIQAIEAANLAPSPGNLPVLKYIIIENPETKDRIAEACRQEFLKEAPFLVVICSDSKKVGIMYDEQADKYTKQHAGAAIENFLLKITDLGLASCWIGAFSELIIRNALKIPENIGIEAILPVAYPLKTGNNNQKTKTPLTNRIYFETWKNTHKSDEVLIRREDI